MRTILAAVAEFERAQIALRTRAAKQQAKREGRYRGGRAPYGWRNVEGELAEIPEEQAVIATARRAQGQWALGWTETARYLTSVGMLARNGRPFVATQVKRMVEG